MEEKLVSLARIERAIRILRGQKVLLDEDLALLYGVSTKRFNEQVRRNLDRFPEDFMFRLTEDEVAFLRSQSATLDLSRDRTTGRHFLRSQIVTLETDPHPIEPDIHRGASVAPRASDGRGRHRNSKALRAGMGSDVDCRTDDILSSRSCA